MQNNKKRENGIVIYKNKDGKISVDVQLLDDTLWLSLNQIAHLFERDKSVISRHLGNIFNEKELDKSSAVAKFATVQGEGRREVNRQIEYYNLDVIISVGYRVNSKRGTEFRRWASQVLNDHLIKGFTINQNNLNDTKIKQFQQTIELLSATLVKQELVNELGGEVIEIIRQYAKTWEILLRYDENRFDGINIKRKDKIIKLTYEEALKTITTFRLELVEKSEAGDLFGREREGALQGILGNIVQTWDNVPLYNSNIERAVHLLYFVIKDHPFSDGNKRIGCLLFLIYLKKANIMAKIDNNSLTAIALLVAESKPYQKEIMIQLITNLLV